MKNKDVCKNFIEGKNAKGSNLESIDGKLYSYNTCIAEKIEEGIIINETKYSTSTSTHQGYLYRLLNDSMIYAILNNVPIGRIKLT